MGQEKKDEGEEGCLYSHLSLSEALLFFNKFTSIGEKQRGEDDF